MIETEIDSIRLQMNTQTRVVVLKEVQGQRHLPIWIGEYEAQAIAIELQGVESPRPMPYDVLKSVITELGGAVERILIVDLSHDVYFARIVISDGDRLVEIDSRPSDAIALAVRVGVPIMVDESVMDKAGVSLPTEPDEHVELDRQNGDETLPPGSTVDDERLSVFRDFVNTLDSEDFDKGSDS